MKSYEVAIPFTGAYYTTVEAASKEEALQLAFVEAENELCVRESEFGFSEWELTKEITRGNVFRGVLNEAYVVER